MALKNINQTIKINAETKNAVRDILQVRVVLEKVPNTAKIGANLVNTSLNSMTGGFDKLKGSILSTITSFTAMYVGITQIKNAFSGIILDALSVRRLLSAILSAGVSIEISSQAAQDFANSLLDRIGQSAGLTVNTMSKLIDAGVTSQKLLLL